MLTCVLALLRQQAGKPRYRELLKEVELFCQQEQSRLYLSGRLYCGQPLAGQNGEEVRQHE
jgi:hypothetical protein